MTGTTPTRNRRLPHAGRLLLLPVLLAWVACASTLRPPAPTATTDQGYVGQLQSEARKLAAVFATRLVRDYLAATASLPRIDERAIFHNEGKSRFYTAAERAALDEALAQGLTPMKVDEKLYYSTRYGTPLTYARPLEVLGEHGLESVAGLRVFDFGYGYIGHLRLLATLGADARGVDVNASLPALYGEPGDQGAVHGAIGVEGRITLYSGRFPADEEVREAIGGGYDLFISKNVLKRGYIHPEREVDPKMRIDLGVDDATYLKILFEMLEPGGRALIYNIYPKQAPPDQPYITWADGRCAFTEAQWRAAGFDVLVYDRDDSEFIREMGRLLGWDQPTDGEPGYDLDSIFALFTLVAKPAP